MKGIKPLYKKYKDKGFKVLSVSIDDSKTISRLKGFIKQKKDTVRNIA